MKSACDHILDHILAGIDFIGYQDVTRSASLRVLNHAGPYAKMKVNRQIMGWRQIQIIGINYEICGTQDIGGSGDSCEATLNLKTIHRARIHTKVKAIYQICEAI